MGTLEKCKDYIAANRPALVAKAEGLLKQWHGRPYPGGSVVYQLNDQNHFEDLFEDLNLTEEDHLDVGESDVNITGDVDIWIEAARNLGFADYVTRLEEVKAHGI